MITSKQELKDILLKEKNIYGIKFHIRIRDSYTHEPTYLIWKWLRNSRYYDYYKHRLLTEGGFINKLLFFYYSRKKNLLGERLGIDAETRNVETGLIIYHIGSVIINGGAVIGKNCILHGQNCIGNKGASNSPCPHIGDNVEIGVGAKIIGDVQIANGIRIGAGSVVVQSFTDKNVIRGGVPARIVHQ